MMGNGGREKKSHMMDALSPVQKREFRKATAFVSDPKFIAAFEEATRNDLPRVSPYYHTHWQSTLPLPLD